jgi:hypothetical protein
MVRLYRNHAPDLPALRASIREVRSHDLDHHVRLGDLAFEPTTTRSGALHEVLTLRRETTGEMIALTEESLPRACRFLRVPPHYAEKLPSALAANMLNFHLQARGDELGLLRLTERDGLHLRALLPASFVRIDDAMVANLLADLKGTDTLRAAHCAVLEDHLHLRLVHDTPFAVDPAGRDLVYPGLDIYNSEVGAGPLRVRMCLVRQVCTNGMTIGEQLDERLRLDNRAIDHDQVRNVLAHALAGALDASRNLEPAYRRLHDVRVPAPTRALEVFLSRHRLGSPRGRTSELILAELLQTSDLFGASLFDFVQAVTAVAGTLGTAQRLAYEDAVGQLLVKGDWRELMN